MEKRKAIRVRRTAKLRGLLPFRNILYFILILIFMELVFHIAIYKSIDWDIFYPIIFSVPIGGFLGVITGLFNKRVNYILTGVITGLLGLSFAAQKIYFYVFKVFLSIYSIGTGTGQVLEFWKEILIAIASNIPYLVIFFIPLIFLLVYEKKNLNFSKKPLKQSLVLFVGNIAIYLVCLLSIALSGKDVYSPYDLYFNNFVMELSMKKLGNSTTTALDLKRVVFGVKDQGLPTDFPDEDVEVLNPVEPGEEEPDYDTSPNIMNINFKDLAASESNETLKNMHQYFDSQEPTKKNKYTGIFEGYNLIFLTAEGFSPYAVREDVTPTLYKLVNEGFVFKNFYNPIWEVSTSDGEYVACTGLIPKSGLWSFQASAKNYLPFVMGNQFNALGYPTRAYHNHSYKYYRRDLSHPNMGYDYKGLGNGLNVKKTWPESDLEMMEVTIPEYINEERFHTYYMTVSGHMNYTFEGNTMANKNKKLVEGLDLSEQAKAYIACNIELDKALEFLLKSLEEAGIADKTAIVLSADHYPYGLPKENIDELAGHNIEENFELYKSNLIIWSGSIKEPIVVDKYSSSLDIIPTISNLFGLEYDSRLLMGRDILSDSPPLVIFNNRSFITDKVMYNSRTGEVINLTEEAVDEEYLSNYNKIINNKFIYSAKVLETDYYRHVVK